VPSVPPSSLSLSPEEHLCEALRSLIQAYRGLEGEEQEEQVGQLVDYTQNILIGKNPFAKEEEEEEAKEVLKGLVEEVRALRKEVAPIKETYAERLKKDLPSLSSLPSSSSFTPPSSSRVTSSTPSSSSTSTRSKKKQL